MNHKILKLEEARNREIAEELKQHMSPTPLYCQAHAGKELHVELQVIKALFVLGNRIVHCGYMYLLLTAQAM